MQENLSGGRETYIPPRLLYGLIPQCLLDNYRFWQDEKTVARGATDKHASRWYKRLLGYPIALDGEHMIIVELKGVGSFMEINKVNCLECTGLPGRSVQVRRVNKAWMEEEFMRRMQVAAVLERAGMLIPVAAAARNAQAKAKKAKAQARKEGKASKTEALTYKVGHDCMVDCFQDGNYFAAEVESAAGNGKYTVKMKDGGLRGVVIKTSLEFMDREHTQEEVGAGKSIWHWTDMEEEENAMWAGDAHHWLTNRLACPHYWLQMTMTK